MRPTKPMLNSVAVIVRVTIRDSTVLRFATRCLRSTVTDQRRPDRLRATSGVWPLPGAASNRCRRARPRVSNLRAHARSARRRQGLPARRHPRAGAGARRRAGARGRRRPLPPLDRRAVAAGIEGTVAYRAEEYVAAESLDVAMRHYAPATRRQGAAVHHAARVGARFCPGRRRWPRRAAPARHLRHPGRGARDGLRRRRCARPPGPARAGAPAVQPARTHRRPAVEHAGRRLFARRHRVRAPDRRAVRRVSGEEMGPLTGATLGERESEVRAVLARAMHADPGGAIRDCAGLLGGAVAGVGCCRDADLSCSRAPSRRRSSRPSRSCESSRRRVYRPYRSSTKSSRRSPLVRRCRSSRWKTA